jgi:hypothetical protein
MDGLTRVTQQAEKPGRLQLAIVEWQRQLIAQREARTSEGDRPPRQPQAPARFRPRWSRLKRWRRTYRPTGARTYGRRQERSSAS